MDAYIIILTIVGLIILMATWLPLVLQDKHLTVPIICVLFGIALSWAPVAPFALNPLENRYLTEHFTEFVVIVALMGAGLKLDRPFGLRAWRVTWRLLIISMPLTIGAITLLGMTFLALPLASALLLGAALAPTDPVLAADVQVGPPESGEEDEVRFSLTSEAGLNDGLAFPFVFLAIALASMSDGDIMATLGSWFAMDVVWRIGAGTAMGWLTGRILGYLTFKLPRKTALADTRDGLAAIGITCIAYGLAEIVHGYGFISVFTAALTLRAAERRHEYHRRLHGFAEQVERLLMMLLMVCFGITIGSSDLLALVSWQALLVATLTLLVIRPLCGWIGMSASTLPAKEKILISFFGLRGLGSFYYLAFATGEADFAGTETLWITVFLIVLASITLHGLTVTPAMRWLDRS